MEVGGWGTTIHTPWFTFLYSSFSREEPSAFRLRKSELHNVEGRRIKSWVALPGTYLPELR